MKHLPIILLLAISVSGCKRTYTDSKGKYQVCDSCIWGHYEYYSYTSLMPVGKVFIPVYHHAKEFKCDSTVHYKNYIK